MKILRRFMIAMPPLMMALLCAGQASHAAQTLQSKSDASPLMEKVRAATWRFKDINAAIAAGFVQGTPCVSGPDAGAMGVHFVMPARINNFVLRADEPQALIYEPFPGGAFRLVGVEFIVLASVWQNQPDGATSTPALDGRSAELRERAESLRSSGILRAACLGVGRQPERKLRRLEHARYLRKATGQLSCGREHAGATPACFYPSRRSAGVSTRWPRRGTTRQVSPIWPRHGGQPFLWKQTSSWQ